MLKVLRCSIDVSKIPKDLIKITDKNGNPFKNGAKYVNITIFLNDVADTYGNHGSITLDVPKGDERKIYVGNGKIVYDESKKRNDDIPF